MRNSLNHPRLDFNAAVSFIQEQIEMERVNIEANRLLNNNDEYLTKEYKVTHCELLLALLYGNRSHSS